MIWKKAISFSLLSERSKETLVDHIGIKFIEIGNNFLEASMPVDERTRQPLGLLNGGASLALAESLASTAANFAVDDEHYCVGLEINANHMRSVKTGARVVGRCEPLHLGQSTQVWQIHIFNHNEDLVCASRMTLAVLKCQSD